MERRFGKVWPTQEALNKYMKEHPKANPRNHSVALSAKGVKRSFDRAFGYFEKREKPAKVRKMKETFEKVLKHVAPEHRGTFAKEWGAPINLEFNLEKFERFGENGPKWIKMHFGENAKRASLHRMRRMATAQRLVNEAKDLLCV